MRILQKQKMHNQNTIHTIPMLRTKNTGDTRKMTLSKKYYKAIAEIIAYSNNTEDIINGLCTYFKQDNPRFNPTKFKEHIKLTKQP